MDGRFRRFSDYDFRHFVATAADAGDGALVHRLLALTDRGRNSWFAARDVRNEVDGYMADLERARELAGAEAAGKTKHRAAALGLQCRYALIAALMRELASNHRPELAARYVQAGMWSRDQALGWVHLARDPQEALKAAVNALHGIEEARRDEVARLALDIGASITDSDSRVLSVADLAPHLPASLQGRTLEIVSAENNEGSRLGGLRSLTPRLNPPLRLEALRVAHSFSDSRLKSEALAVVAPSLEDPERSRTFEASLAAGLSVAATATTSSALDGLAQSLPREQQLELLRRLEGEPSARAVRDSVFSVYLLGLAEEQPDQVVERIAGVRDRREDILVTVSVGFAKKGRWKEAALVASKVSTFWLGLRSDAWQMILAILPEPEWQQWIDLFATLSADQRLNALLHFMESESIPASVVRKLAATLTDPWDSLKSSSIVAKFLSEAELEVVLEQSLTNPRAPSVCLANIAPCLSMSQVRRALTAVRVSYNPFSDPRGSLLARLVQLGQPDEAIAWVSGLENTRESDRAQMLARLAPLLPDDRMPALRAATRPDNVANARIRARAALLPFLPPENGNQILSSLAELADADERMAVLSEMIDNLPATALEGAIALILSGAPAIIESRGRDLARVFRTLSRALRRAPSTDATARSIALACDATISPPGQVTLLMDLTSAGGPPGHILRCVEAALNIAFDDADAAWKLQDQLRAVHAAALGELLAHAEPERLAIQLQLSAAALDEKSRGLVLRRLPAVPGAQLRLSALEALLPFLSARERKWVAGEETRKQPEWGEHLVFGFGLLARHVPELQWPPRAEVLAAFRRMPQQEKISYAGYLAGYPGIGEAAMEDAFATTCTLSPADKGAALVVLAPWLNRDQVEKTLDDWDSVDDSDLRRALALRAIDLADTGLLTRCLREEENSLTRSRLIRSIAWKLPVRLISWVADLNEQSPITGHIHTEGLEALAVRAAKLGDFDLALRLADERGNNRFSGDRTLETIYSLAPPSRADELIARAEKMFPFERAPVLAAYVNRLPVKQRKSVLMMIIIAARELTAGKRADLLCKLHHDIARMQVSELVSIWTESLRHSATKSRDEVLEDVVWLSPILAERLGRTVAAELESAIAFGGVDFWP